MQKKLVAFVAMHTVPFLLIGLALILILSGAVIYETLTISKLTNANGSFVNDLETTKAMLQEKEMLLSEYSKNLDDLKQAYALSEENGTELLDMLTKEKNKNDAFEEQIQDISSTVGKLDKLSKIDPELLMKYSKVSFLNEHYAPEKVTEIASSSTFKKNEPEYIQANVAPFLTRLLERAQRDGITLKIVSAYRSYDEQKSLKSAYTVQYGSGANTFSADQGYSEHQLGTTVDFTTEEIGGGLTGFEKTEAYAWLQKNAYKFGFILSYPENNAYYIFEPWHWRFVGEDLARHLSRENLTFYTMDQREIDTYLISIFD